MIPDESYWSMLAQHLGHKITGDLTTYMEPGDAKTGHSKMFTDQDVPQLWAQPKPSFFARKFATTPKNDKNAGGADCRRREGSRRRAEEVEEERGGGRAARRQQQRRAEEERWRRRQGRRRVVEELFS